MGSREITTELVFEGEDAEGQEMLLDLWMQNRRKIRARRVLAREIGRGDEGQKIEKIEVPARKRLKATPKKKTDLSAVRLRPE